MNGFPGTIVFIKKPAFLLRYLAGYVKFSVTFLQHQLKQGKDMVGKLYISTVKILTTAVVTLSFT